MSTNLEHRKRERRRKRESRRLACVAGAKRGGEGEGEGEGEKHEKEMFMNNSIWPLTMLPPQGIPPGICKFFRCWWSIFPSPGTQKETIPHPWGPDRPHMHIFWVHLFETNIVFRTIAKRDIFITLFNVFYLEKDNKCIMWINMNNKFENEKSQRKNPKGPIWHDHSY